MSNMDDETFKDLYQIKMQELDPLRLYVNHAAQRAAQSKGLERLAFAVFGFEMIGSFALALDPSSSFKQPFDPRKSEPKFRTRIRSKPPYKRKKTVTTSSSQISNAHRQTIFGGDTHDVTTTGPTVTETQLADFPLLEDFITDTTDKLREPFAKGGEMEKFTCSLRYSSPSVNRRIYTRNFQNVCNHGMEPDLTNISNRSYAIQGPFAVLSLPQQVSLRTLEENRSDELISEYRDVLLSRTLPLAPSFNLFRSLAELRDLNRLADLSEIPRKLKERIFTLKDLAGSHLAVEFGIKPLISDVQRMLELPDTIAKRVNYLLERNGKPTTFRRKIFLEEDISGFTPTWSTTGTSDKMWTTVRTTNSRKRSIELRCSANYNVEFPKLEVPKLRKNIARKLWGIEPTFSDLYELTPWSWLIDWFTGLGNYLQAIEDINQNSSLVNDAWISYVSKCSVSCAVTQELTYYYTDRHAISKKGARYSLQLIAPSQTDFVYSFHKRVNVADIGVSTVNGLRNLNDSQSLILGALFTQRTT